MTNIFGSPRKVTNRNALVAAGAKVLEEQGWRIERVPGIGKSSVRRIVRNGSSKLVSIKTTQDTWLAFARTPDDKEWSTLSDVEAVVVVSVDDRDKPQMANVHIMDAQDLTARFDRAYRARKEAGYSIPIGRGIWLSLYEKEADQPVTLVGAGAGLDFPAVGTVRLADIRLRDFGPEQVDDEAVADEPLTIPEAKRRLALTFGVDPSNIKITVES